MLSTTSSSDFGRTLAFAVAECVLDDLDDHLEVFKRSDRVLLAEPTTSPWATPRPPSRTASPQSTVVINLNTPPLPSAAFPLHARRTPSPPSNIRATAPAFQPTQHTQSRPSHTRTQSELLPPADIASPAPTIHRRAASTTQPASPRQFRASDCGVPLPRKSPGKARAGMPTLAEITAHYRSLGRKPSIKDLSSITKDPITPAPLSASPFKKTTPEKRFSLDSVGSRGSWSSDSTASTASEDEPKTPPATHRRSSSGASRLPSFLRDRADSGGDRNPLAEALAEHRRASVPPSPGSEREGKPETPRVKVTPPSTTMDSPPAFPCRRAEGSYFPSRAHVRKPNTTAISTDVPGLSLTPPTAAAHGVSPLKVLEAQLEASKRRERAERMVRLLGKRTGVAV